VGLFLVQLCRFLLLIAVKVFILLFSLWADFLLRIAANDSNGRWAAHHHDFFADSPNGLISPIIA